MAYKQISPQVVAEGGTGVSSNTAYAVLCGGTTTTGAIQSIASVGTAAQVLTSNGAAALPTFQAAAGGVTGPGSSTDNALARWNGTGGDTLQDSTVIVTDAGEMTNASQPAFLGYISTTVANVTGNNVTVFLGDSDVGAGLTEVYDQNADFVPSASGGAVFTAPVTGKYHFVVAYGYSDLGSSNTGGNIRLIASNRGYRGSDISYAAVRDASNIVEITISGFLDLDVTDTCTTNGLVASGTQIVDLLGVTGSDMRTFFAGALIC